MSALSITRPAAIYLSNLITTLAITPLWTVIVPAMPFPTRIAILNSTASLGIEFSIDGTNPILFLQPGTPTNTSATVVDLYQAGIVLPKQVPIYARRIAAGGAGNLRVTLIGSFADV